MVAVLTDMMIIDVVAAVDIVVMVGADTMTVIALAMMTDILDLLAMGVVRNIVHVASIAMRLTAMIAIAAGMIIIVVAAGTTLLVTADVAMETRL